MRIRRKPRDKDETDGFYLLMKAKIEDNIIKGKVRWINDREMERKIDIGNTMKLNINIDEIVQNIDINKLVEEKVASEITDTLDIENIVDGVLENDEMKNKINNKVTEVINNYIESEDCRDRIIDQFNDALSNNILDDEQIISTIVEFLKRKLA